MFKKLVFYNITLLNILISSFVSAQKIEVKDKSTLKPISFVSAFNENTKEWFISDSSGTFVFNSKKTNAITFEVIGYEKKTINILNDTTILLKPNSIYLNEVVVNSKYSKNLQKTFKSRNGFMSSYAYVYSNKLGIRKSIASLISLSDTLNKIKEVSFDAKIFGNEMNQFVRLRLYKVNNIINFNPNSYQKYLENYNEIFSYELRECFPNPEKNLNFTLPDGIILDNGNYLFSIEATPSQNPSQKLILNLSKDEYLHTFFKTNKSWNHDFDNGKFLNMKIKVDYEVL